jgi:hypothetical protein
MKSCLPLRVLQCLARLRAGAALLEVQTGRHSRVPRHRRVCRLCSCNDPAVASKTVWRTRVHARTGAYDNVEDLRHFLLECPAYDLLRNSCTTVFYPDGTVDRYFTVLACQALCTRASRSRQRLVQANTEPSSREPRGVTLSGVPRNVQQPFLSHNY